MAPAQRQLRGGFARAGCVQGVHKLITGRFLCATCLHNSPRAVSYCFLQGT